jgi:hypothetical protein
MRFTFAIATALIVIGLAIAIAMFGRSAVGNGVLAGAPRG